MKHIFLLYDTSCFFEIVILNYFMSLTHCEMAFCSLDGRKSIRSEDLDVVNDRHVITARANAYVDFAVETAKELDLFEDEADLQETIDFWKYHKRAPES